VLAYLFVSFIHTSSQYHRHSSQTFVKIIYFLQIITPLHADKYQINPNVIILPSSASENLKRAAAISNDNTEGSNEPDVVLLKNRSGGRVGSGRHWSVMKTPRNGGFTTKKTMTHTFHA
jgi:hypothetical protein